MGDFRQADFGISHGSSTVAIDRPEVALAIDQHIAQRETLGHANDGVVNGLVAVGGVFTDNVTDDTRGFLISPVPVVVQLVHGKQYPAMHRLEPIPDIGKRPADNYAHGVIQIASAHFLF